MPTLNYEAPEIDKRLGYAGDIPDMKGDIAALFRAVGSPLVAATAAGMTDKTKIYVYTGSETGYTAGNWYYWNSSLATPAWASGGAYNSTALTTDTTLTVAGAAADAKATGDRLTAFEGISDAVASNTNSIEKLQRVSDDTTSPTRNLCNVPIGKFYPNASGEIKSVNSDNIRVGMSEYIPCDSDTDYFVSAFDRGATTSTTFYVAWKDEDGVFIRRDSASRATIAIGWQVTSPENAAFMTFSVYNSTYVSQANTKLQIEKGTVRTDYTPPYSVKDTVAREAVASMASDIDGLSNSLQDAQSDIEDLEDNVNYLMQKGYPPYFQDNLTQAEASIAENMRAIGVNGESFVFITDVHWGNNQKHSPELIKDVLNHTNVRNVVCGGDLMDSGTAAQETAKAEEFMNAMRFCPGGLKYISGNHDFQHGEHAFSSKEVYGFFYPQAEMEWQDIHTPAEKIYGFFDVPATKTRYLNVGMPFSLIRYSEALWIEDQIKNNPDKNIIVFGHYLYDASGEYFMPEALNLMRLCSAYDNVKAIVYGHIHADKVDYTPSGIPVIAVDTDSNRLSTTLNPNTYTIGTITEQAFDTMSVNYDNMDAQCVRVGRGKNRSVHGGTTKIAVAGSTTFETSITSATWVSSDVSIASVVNGVVTGVAAGMAVISAEGENKIEYWSVTVGENPEIVTVTVNGTATLTPVLLTSVTGNSWTSGNTAIVTVDGGVVTGVSAGKTTVRAFGSQNGVANYEFWDVVVVE